MRLPERQGGASGVVGENEDDDDIYEIDIRPMSQRDAGNSGSKALSASSALVPHRMQWSSPSAQQQFSSQAGAIIPRPPHLSSSILCNMFGRESEKQYAVVPYVPRDHAIQQALERTQGSMSDDIRDRIMILDDDEDEHDDGIGSSSMDSSSSSNDGNRFRGNGASVASQTANAFRQPLQQSFAVAASPDIVSAASSDDDSDPYREHIVIDHDRDMVM